MSVDHLTIENLQSTLVNLTLTPNLFSKDNNKNSNLTQSTKTICSTSSDESGIKSETSNLSEISYKIIDLKQNNYSSKTESGYNLSTNSYENNKKISISSSESSSENNNIKNFSIKKQNYNLSSFLTPDFKVRIRTLCLIGAFLPGIGCFFCISYTYLFQLDVVKNFTSTHCKNVNRLILIIIIF